MPPRNTVASAEGARAPVEHDARVKRQTESRPSDLPLAGSWVESIVGCSPDEYRRRSVEDDRREGLQRSSFALDRLSAVRGGATVVIVCVSSPKSRTTIKRKGEEYAQGTLQS